MLLLAFRFERLAELQGVGGTRRGRRGLLKNDTPRWASPGVTPPSCNWVGWLRKLSWLGSISRSTAIDWVFGYNPPVHGQE
jgi:hypothetical protein